MSEGQGVEGDLEEDESKVEVDVKVEEGVVVTRSERKRVKESRKVVVKVEDGDDLCGSD